jgi:hypothetical protein
MILPLDLAFERDPSVVDDNADLFPGRPQVSLDRLDGVTGDLGIRPTVDDGQSHLDVVHETDHAGHPLDVFLGFALLPKAADEPGQRHHTVFDRRYVDCVDVGIRSQLVLHISFDIVVCSHDSTSCSPGPVTAGSIGLTPTYAAAASPP